MKKYTTMIEENKQLNFGNGVACVKHILENVEWFSGEIILLCTLGVFLYI